MQLQKRSRISACGDQLPGQRKHARLVALREWFGLSQAQFARFLGRNQPEFSLMEKGNRTPPYSELASRVAVNINWLLGTSDEMWDHRVHKLRRQIAHTLLQMDRTERERFASPLLAPADRIKHIIEIAMGHDPGLVTPDLVRVLLHMDQEEYMQKVLGGGDMERSDYIRFCEYLGLPVELVELGILQSLDDAAFDEYREVVARLHARGITPQKLGAILDILS